MTSSSLPRACPRCRGRLFHIQDQYGRYSSCLGCGFVHEWVSGPAITRPEEGEDGRRRRMPTHGRQRL
jgi:hypothetical protein